MDKTPQSVEQYTWDQYRLWLQEDMLPAQTVVPSAPHPHDLVTDSRDILPGQFFIPLEGPNFNGHDFIEAALKKGAAGYFTHDPKKKCEKGILVKDTLKTLGLIARGYRKTLKTKIVAITGSVGKTTCKSLIAEVLTHTCKDSTEESVFASKGNFNNEIGVPLSILSLKDHHKFAVIECGARAKGDISYLVDIIVPDVAICLNAYVSHLGNFGSVEQLVQAKSEMFTYAPAACVLIAPTAQPELLSKAKQTLRKVYTFGIVPPADVYVDSQSWGDSGNYNIRLMIQGVPIQWDTHMGHDSLGINAAAACATALALGISPIPMKAGLEKFQPLPGRFSILENNSHTTMIDDAYNASPQSMRAGLKTLIKRYPNARCAIILGDMNELGEQSEKFHFDLGAFCAQEIQPFKLITVGKLAKNISLGALKFGLTSERIIHLETKDHMDKQFWQNLSDEVQVIYAKASNAVGLSPLLEQGNTDLNNLKDL